MSKSYENAIRQSGMVLSGVIILPSLISSDVTKYVSGNNIWYRNKDHKKSTQITYRHIFYVANYIMNTNSDVCSLVRNTEMANGPMLTKRPTYLEYFMLYHKEK